jgi:hypothetical protein
VVHTRIVRSTQVDHDFASNANFTCPLDTKIEDITMLALSYSTSYWLIQKSTPGGSCMKSPLIMS